ncbi:MAG: DUF4250 domain-containing protein, partial [Lachnospiraceae bacterium]|nr:DUF4250 domain-containing protein [Lachnospiraceae bacterium]
KDNVLLYGFINLKLRDYYSSIEDLCEDLELDKDEIIERLKSAGFEYDREHNRFR